MRKILLCFIILSGCTSSIKRSEGSFELDQPLYAKKFHFESQGSTQYLVVNEPWPGATNPIKYDLGKLPETFVCTSTSHLPFFELLDATDKVIGFPNTNYISSKAFNQLVDEGRITDLGPDGTMNMELLIGLGPDALIAFDMGGESKTLEKVKELNIPVFYNSDFLEETPLGRAEWIKFFGALIGKEEMADSIFSKIEMQYRLLTQMVEKIDPRPTILNGVVYGDTWYLPGGANWAATFYRDAGGHYLWEHDTTSGWLELSFEAVFAKANDADFWIGTSTLNNKNELAAQDARYKDFAPFQKDQIYSYNKIIGPNGGYDFFESGYARPDLVLSDLIKILHPELLTEYETVYFQKLE